MKDKGLYFLPKLSRLDFGFFRLGGPGLGNLLFPIARAVVGSVKYRGAFINGTFPQLKIGPFLRREKDKRFYSREFVSSPCKESIKRLNLFLGPTASEDEFALGEALSSVVVFTGLGEFFYPLTGFEDLLRSFFYENNRYQIANERKEGIAVHVRLGDFAPVTARNSGQANVQNSVDWYRGAISRARKIIGNKSRVILFSDEPTKANILFPDLRIANESPNALSELLHMSQYDALVGSNSTFSLWASFLGGGFSIWHKDFDLERYRQPEGKDHMV